MLSSKTIFWWLITSGDEMQPGESQVHPSIWFFIDFISKLRGAQSRKEVSSQEPWIHCIAGYQGLNAEQALQNQHFCEESVMPDNGPSLNKPTKKSILHHSPFVNAKFVIWTTVLHRHDRLTRCLGWRKLDDRYLSFTTRFEPIRLQPPNP